MVPEEGYKTVKREGQGWEQECEGDGEDESVCLACGRDGGCQRDRGHPQSIEETSVIQKLSREQRFVDPRESKKREGERKKEGLCLLSEVGPPPVCLARGVGISRGCEGP